MRKCIGCGYGCRNRCSNCGRGWCATCRNTTGSATCSVCVNNKAQKQQLAQQRAQQRRAAMAQANAPVYVPSQPVIPPPTQLPGQGKALFEMTDDEKHDWLVAAKKALEAKIEHDSAYLLRRASRGPGTATDQLLSADLQNLVAILETLELELDQFLPTSTFQPKNVSHTEMLMGY
jgi:hypothetical protein